MKRKVEKLKYSDCMVLDESPQTKIRFNEEVIVFSFSESNSKQEEINGLVVRKFKSFTSFLNFWRSFVFKGKLKIVP